MNIWLLGALAIVVAAVLWYIMTMNPPGDEHDAAV